jgi:SAM-dependent methyltransferase
VNSLHPQRGSLLEIGSGFGYLLARFREDGWDVSGCDPWKAVCAYAEKTHGIQVSATILEDAGIADQSVDVVIMNHVIEHMTDPLQSLREINRILKLGGHLIIETPRYDTLMFKLLGRRERSVSCDGHIYFFTNASLEKLYNKAGFRKVKLWYTGRTLSIERLMWNIGTITKSNTVKKCLASLSTFLHLRKVRIYLNTRDMQRVCVQKL